MTALDLVIGIFVVLLGLAFGSFLNVCIARLPRHESIVSPPSQCPYCGSAIRAGDNIPLLSYALLGGRCRDCGAGISWRYPAVEFATAALWLLCLLVFGQTVKAGFMAIFCFLTLGLAAMDAETMMLPDAITVPGIVLGLAWSGFAAGSSWWRGAAMGAMWAVCGAGLILLIRGAYWLARRREGLGLGDAKLFAMLAAWLGMADALLIFFLAVVGGAIYGLLQGRKAKESVALTRVPLGAFLCVAAIFTLFAGRRMIDWYLAFF